MSKSVKRWAKKARVALMIELGPFCHWPGCHVNALKPEGGVNLRVLRKLQFDHIDGKDWEATGKSTDQRMVLYRKEAREGKIQPLCELHNQVKGDPRGRPWWKHLWMEDLYSASFGERVEA